MPSTRWLALLLLLIPTPAHAAWVDAAWPCRRTVDIAWNADKAAGGEIAMAEVYTDGHGLPTAADVRVATDDGKPVPFTVLTAGPGDRVRLAFALAKDVKRYAVYFGHPAPPATTQPELPITAGLLMETKVFNGGSLRTFEQLQHAWDRGGPLLGRTLIGHPFHGYNPFDDTVAYVSRLTGTLYAPADGDYLIAAAVDDDAAIYLDGHPTLVAHLGGADVRYHATAHLTRGPHAFLMVHVNAAGPGFISVGWQPPGDAKVSIIPRAAFGNLFADGNVVVGPLEIKGKALVGDLAADRVAECFIGPADDAYAFHYRFTGRAKAGLPVGYDWDFGDGQTGTGSPVDHAYLRPGVYAVRCTAHAGTNADAQTCRLVVGRDYLHLPLAKEEPAAALSALAAKLDLSAVPPVDLPTLVRLHLTAGKADAAVTAATTLAGQPSPPEGGLATLTAVEQVLLDANRPDPAVSLWEHVPVTSSLRPTAARRAAELALWWDGDAARAAALVKADPDAKLAYAHALLLSGHADQARPILESARPRSTGSRKAALSGADARTVEFYITEAEPDPGDAAWQRWMADFPTDFLGGYSVLLRTKLMEVRHRDAAAATLAEAFADAVPTSSYAPQLLDRAAKLLAKTDPDKAAALRQRLKQKYPEDPLSQN